MARVEWDESGCYVILNDDELQDLSERVIRRMLGNSSFIDVGNVIEILSETRRLRVLDVESMHDSVRAQIGPWLEERNAAREEFDAHIAAGDVLYEDPTGKRVWVPELPCEPTPGTLYEDLE